MAIHYYEQDIQAQLKDKRKLSQYLTTIVKKHLPDVRSIQLSYIFCGDEYLLEINRNYLQHDTFTDIITFDLSENEKTLIGEIYISAERIKENSLKYSMTYNQELHRVIFHGILHLCGFKDKTKSDKEEMRKLEDKCLKEYLG